MFKIDINYIKYILYVVIFVQLSCSCAMAIENTAVQDNSNTQTLQEEQVVVKEKTKKRWFRKKKKADTQQLAVEEVKDENSQQLAGKIDFDDVVTKAKEHSYDLKIADYNVLIAKTAITNARSEYLPKLYFSASTEYSKSFREDDFIRGAGAVSVGDSYINPYTRFQSVLGITLAYNLFDFGVRRGNLNIAKTDVTLKELQKLKADEELMLNLVDTYAKVEMYSKQISAEKEILKIEQNSLNVAQRLFDAKYISKTELNDRTTKVALADKRIHELSALLQESLNWINFYTGENYVVDGLKVKDIKKPDFDANAYTDYTKTLIWQIYEKEIKKKELALFVAKRNYLPKVNVYGRYYFYGSNKNNYGKSISDIKPSTATIGASLSVPIFDGLKNKSNVDKAKLELGQIQVERDKSIAEWLNRVATLRSNLAYIDKQIAANEKIIKELKDKNKSVGRMLDNKLVLPIELNDAKVQLIEQKIDLEKNKTTYISILRGIQILTADEEQTNDK